MKSQPLVTILIPNYNHSVYLDDSIQSALNQTYGNIEVILLDNQSEDNSLQVMQKYAGARVRICRNAYNYVNFSYHILSELLVSSETKYMMMLPADDFIKPAFVKKAVTIMEEHENVGYVHVERDFITDQGVLIELDPFYKCSFIAGGRETMPIYMMTTVAHPAQGIFRKSGFDAVHGYDAVVDHMNADKNLWFYLSSVSDYAYIREKLSCIRIGSNTETLITQTNFQHPVLSFMTVLEFADFAERNGFTAAAKRKGAALDKLAVEFINHIAGALNADDFILAERYFTFCRIMSPKIEENEVYKTLLSMAEAKSIDKNYLSALAKKEQSRKRSYDPPDGYTSIEI
jgi:glycosyltransferase involved in cell wall biosynthesis